MTKCCKTCAGYGYSCNEETGKCCCKHLKKIINNNKK